MRTIPLRRRDGTVRALALVDEADHAELSSYRWHVNQVSHNAAAAGYAVRWDGEPRQLIQMSRQILGLIPGDGLQADHINGDTLDNRRSNLRVVTQAQNMQNRRSHKDTSSRFRSVYWAIGKQRWCARVRVNNTCTHIGYFRDELAAAQAAEAFRQVHMPFAEPDPELVAALALQVPESDRQTERAA